MKMEKEIQSAVSRLASQSPLATLAEVRFTDSFIGVSRWANRMRSAIQTHELHDRPLLITGEAGTGKKHLAGLIHAASSRRFGPFRIVNCTDISPSSLEAAVFGEVRKNADGASRISKGAVELARGGTLYLQDFHAADDSFANQIRHLLVGGTYHLVGSEVIEKADVRLIIALTASASGDSEGVAIPIDPNLINDRIGLIPLCERREDIVPLAEEFLQTFCDRYNREPRRFEPAVETVLTNYSWPGNVAELKMVVERTVSRLAPAEISLDHLPEALRGNVPPATALSLGNQLDLSELMKATERQIICEALRVARGRQNKAAKLLQVNKSTFSAKLARLKIDPRNFIRKPS